MVIQDIWAGQPNKEKSEITHQKMIRSAKPLDRLAAAVIDVFIVLAPLLLLFIAPFRKNIVYASLLNNELSLIFNIVCIVFVVALSFFIYQFICFHFLGATIGKRFFQLQVVDAWSFEAPKWSQVFLRTLFLLLQSLLGGLSFLSFFLNQRRRMIHDQISETMVVGQSENESFPHWIEKRLAHLVLGFLSVILLSVFFSQMFFLYQGMQGKGAYVDYFENKGLICSEVTDAQRELEAESLEHERLEVALALFGSQTIDEKCLKKEVDHYFRYETIGSMGYLAKSFVFSESAAQSDAYLAQTCKVNRNSDSCRLSRIVELWGQEKWGLVKEEFMRPWKEGSLYAHILAVRHFLNREDFKNAQMFLSKVPQGTMFSHFHAIHKAKVQWGLGQHQQARAIASVFASQFDDEQNLSLSQWLCERETKFQCQNFTTESCNVFKKVAFENPVSFKSEKVSRLLIREQVCHSSKGALAKFQESNRTFPQAAQEYLSSMVMFKVGHHKAAKNKLMEIAILGKSKVFRQEAFLQLLQASHTQKELNDLVLLWNKEEDDQIKRKWGRELILTFFKHQKMKWVAKIGEELAKAQPLEYDDMRRVIVARYVLGQKKKVKELYDQFFRESKKVEVRFPASLDLDKSFKQLQYEFGDL